MANLGMADRDRRERNRIMATVFLASRIGGSIPNSVVRELSLYASKVEYNVRRDNAIDSCQIIHDGRDLRITDRGIEEATRLLGGGDWDSIWKSMEGDVPLLRIIPDLKNKQDLCQFLLFMYPDLASGSYEELFRTLTEDLADEDRLS